MRLVLANGLFWGNALVAALALGITLLGVSFGCRWKKHILALMPGHHLSLVSVFLVGSGCVLLVVSLFGLCISRRLCRRDRIKEGGFSAERGARGCAVYNAMALVVMANVVVSAVLVYRCVMHARRDVDEDLKYAMYQYFVDASSRDKLDSLHKEFKCCGVRNYTDWTMVTAGAQTGARGHKASSSSSARPFVPRTCCVVESSGGACIKYHEQGCQDVLVDYLNMLMPTVLFCAICVAVWLVTRTH
ncbi:hypothetical protein HPB50_021236 [Hyalomma asiaticum]|uniref:Uncharacterized protein n=1 Tax=Hyalomma asiaticum TaxID=266040 RepID=A0ACB7RUV2_HYAAI|nr:hypothetical protein HPB50_021236 [Hyalomma asiaticum]